jgi:hypothetical protein
MATRISADEGLIAITVLILKSAPTSTEASVIPQIEALNWRFYWEQTMVDGRARSVCQTRDANLRERLC